MSWGRDWGPLLQSVGPLFFFQLRLPGGELHRFRPMAPAALVILVPGADAISMTSLDNFVGKSHRGLGRRQFGARPVRLDFVTARLAGLISSETRRADRAQAPLHGCE